MVAELEDSEKAFRNKLEYMHAIITSNTRLAKERDNTMWYKNWIYLFLKIIFVNFEINRIFNFINIFSLFF